MRKKAHLPARRAFQAIFVPQAASGGQLMVCTAWMAAFDWQARLLSPIA